METGNKQFVFFLFYNTSTINMFTPEQQANQVN